MNRVKKGALLKEVTAWECTCGRRFFTFKQALECNHYTPGCFPTEYNSADEECQQCEFNFRCARKNE